MLFTSCRILRLIRHSTHTLREIHEFTSLCSKFIEVYVCQNLSQCRKFWQSYCKNKMVQLLEGQRLGPSVCLSVCLSPCLSYDNLHNPDLESSSLVWGYTSFTKFLVSYVKVIGSMSRSRAEKLCLTTFQTINFKHLKLQNSYLAHCYVFVLPR